MKLFFTNDKKEPSYKRMFILFIVIIITISILLWFTIGKFEQNVKKKQERDFTETLKKEISRAIVDKLDQYSELLFITAHSTVITMQYYQEHSDMIEKLYTEVLFEIPSFFELRYIDPDGNETHRVNKTQGQIYIVPPGELQDKSDRYTFREAVSQNLWYLYISPLDLSIENGQIVDPWIPTIRMATPVPDPYSGRQGIVIINIDLTDAISFIKNDTSGRQCYLLNSDGYYMAGAEKDKLWGFMFGNDITFKKDYPAAWPQISLNNNGSFIQSGKLYSYTTINASELSERQLERYDNPDNNIWKVVVLSGTNFGFLPYGPYGIIISITVLIISFFVGLGWTRNAYERKKAVLANEETRSALIKSEKMASLGRLVAGVAHELNTPIGSSITIASTIQDSVNRFAEAVKSGQIRKSSIDEFLATATMGTDTMLKSLDRASTLITHFKQVSVDQSSEHRRIFKLPDYINDILDTLKPTFKHRDISIDVIASQTVDIDSYPGAFAQVISNLINNSVIHGFPGDSPGNIKIQVQKELDKVMISIRDNGTGIPKENMERIFEPFFTTSESTGGSGLGLHIVYNIVNDLLGGTLRVRSKAGEFTEFVIELPLTL